MTVELYTVHCTPVPYYTVHMYTDCTVYIWGHVCTHAAVLGHIFNPAPKNCTVHLNSVQDSAMHDIVVQYSAVLCNVSMCSAGNDLN